jgi:alkylation response protein AidB-like acyl-CoA dehydrogenase
LRERNAYGAPLGRFTHLQQELAEHVARLHMAWLLVKSSAERQDARQPAFADACMAKAEGIEAALAATDWAMRVHGARGQSTLLDLDKRHRDLRALRIAGGPPDVLRSQVARAVLGNALYYQALGRDVTNHEADPNLGGRRFWP